MDGGVLASEKILYTIFFMPFRPRNNISQQVATHLRELIVEGRLDAGQRINEVELASELEVSRTPVREALSRLASEGLVTSRPRRGFFVQDPDLEEVEQLYGIRAILDPAALKLGGLPARDQVARLRALNAELREATDDPDRAVDLDDRWHLELLDHCPNRILLDLIRQFMQRTRPLELAYMRSRETLEAVGDEHGEILDAVEAGDLDRAVGALRSNMESGLSPILRWLGCEE